jgi:hypothetical protein
MSKRNAGERGYDIGKGRPPVHSRYPKGKSGNPGGKKRGTLNLVTILRKVLFEQTMTLSENGEEYTVCKLEGVTQRLVYAALRDGNVRAAEVVLRYGAHIEMSEQGAPETSEEDRAILARWLRKSRRRPCDPQSDHQDKDDG